jgi:hypothetical protein
MNKPAKTQLNTAVELRQLFTAMDSSEVQSIRDNYQDAMTGLVNLRIEMTNKPELAQEMECVLKAIDVMQKIRFGAVL